LALNELDRASRRYEVSGQVAADNPSIVDEHQDNQQLNPQEKLQKSELKQALWQALKTLEPHDRSLLALAYLKDLEFAAIAEIEGIPVGTVKSRLHRIRQQLKSILSGVSP